MVPAAVSAVSEQEDDDELVIPADYVAHLFDLAGRVAVVTGGGSGLGQAIAIGYAQAGVTVILADVNDAGTAETVARIAEQGGRAYPDHLDVTDKAEVDALADSVVERFGRVDILVNSAGTAFRVAGRGLPRGHASTSSSTSTSRAPTCAARPSAARCLPRARAASSTWRPSARFIAYPWASAYLASKGGVLGVTRGLALEWRDRGVRVNGIGPDAHGLAADAWPRTTTSLTADFIKARMLRPRLGLPRELIGAAIYLASDAASLVTGHTIMCDDGYLVGLVHRLVGGTMSEVDRIVRVRAATILHGSRCPSSSAAGSCVTASSSWCASTPRAGCGLRLLPDP